VADTRTASAARRLVVGLLGTVALLAACGDSPKSGDVDEVLAQLRSAEPALRYEAVVRLGMLPPSQARRDGLARGVRDGDDAVRLMAGIVVIGDGPTEHAGWLQPRREAPAPSTSRSTPNPSPREGPLSPLEALVYLDPWFAGTLVPGALVAAQDGDARVRTLGQRALDHTKPR
jgi:hypothetical protein